MEWSEILSLITVVTTVLLGIMQLLISPKRAKTQEHSDFADAANSIASASKNTIETLMQRVEVMEEEVRKIPALEAENLKLRSALLNEREKNDLLIRQVNTQAREIDKLREALIHLESGKQDKEI